MLSLRVWLSWLAWGLAFGAAVALVKGDGAGIRDAVGNLSAPWLVLPFLSGRGRGRAAAAALLGALTSLASVAAFCLCESGAFLHIYPSVAAADSSGLVQRIALGAVVSGPVMALLGLWWARTRSRAAGLAVGLAFALEPLAVWLYPRLEGYRPQLDHPGVYAAEVFAGVLTCIMMLRYRRA